MRERERGGARAPERARVGSFWWSRREGVFETRERERGGARAPERACVGTFWWSRWGGVPEHQNEPMWARSGVRDEGEGEGRCASTRMSPHGLVVVFKTRERERGG